MRKEEFRFSALEITGAPGTGKSTITNYLREWLGLDRIPGHTTRERRPGEIQGFDFHYVNALEFLRNWRRDFYTDLCLQDTWYNGNYYGSPRTWLVRVEASSIFTPTCTNTARHLVTVDPSIAWVHLYAPQEERKQRLKRRQTSKMEVNYRLRKGDSQGTKPEALLNINTAEYSLEDTMQMIYWKILRQK
ncbi:MAG: AAA family ATPase [Patescibacteria group bacterium]|nr:AAA family ATPase [Patescibacteria group bacterium]